jgi:hypothetical protein
VRSSSPPHRKRSLCMRHLQPRVHRDLDISIEIIPATRGSRLSLRSG